MWKREGLALLFALLIPITGVGQNLVLKDTLVLATIKHPAGRGASLVKLRINQEMDYSLTGTSLLFLNWQQGGNANLVSLLQRFNYRSQVINDKNVKITNSFMHELGVQYFPDSISRFQPDENSLETWVEAGIGKNISFSFLSKITTSIFNSYFYETDQTGNFLKTLRTSFLTPMVWTFSIGFSCSIPQLGTINLGLSAAKLTWVCNRAVYVKQNSVEFYGVPREKTHVFEYGLSMQLKVDKDVFKLVHWSCDLQIFKNYRKPVDVTMKNLVGIKINRFLKSSIQTRLYYEKEVSKRIQVENLVSLGFYFCL